MPAPNRQKAQHFIPPFGMGLCTQSFRPFRIGIHSSLAGWDGKSSQMNRATFRRSSQRDSRMASAFDTWLVFEGCWKSALLPTPLVIRSKRRCIGGRQGVGHPLRSHCYHVSQLAICLIHFCLYRYRIGLGFVSFDPKKTLNQFYSNQYRLFSLRPEKL